MARRKILLVIDSLVRGGAQRQLVELACRLDRRHYDIRVVVYHDIPQLKGELDARGIEVTLVGKGGTPASFVLRMARHFRRVRPDIVHAYLWAPGFWARICGVLAGTRNIITSERNTDIGHSRKAIWCERLLNRLSSRIIVNAEAIRDTLVSAAWVPRHKIDVIRNGVDTDVFGSVTDERVRALRAKVGLDGTEFVMTLPGRLAPQKNHRCLLLALQSLQELPLNARLLFVGNEVDPPLSAELRRQVRSAGLGDRVIFGGGQDDMPAVYGASDVIVLPSLWEGFPNVVLEAMAAGRPVVCSNISDNRRLVREGITGFVFPSDDAGALAGILQRILRMRPAELRALGKAGQRIAGSEYSIDSMVAATEGVYRELLGAAT